MIFHIIYFMVFAFIGFYHRYISHTRAQNISNTLTMFYSSLSSFNFFLVCFQFILASLYCWKYHSSNIFILDSCFVLLALSKIYVWSKVMRLMHDCVLALHRLNELVQRTSMWWCEPSKNKVTNNVVQMNSVKAINKYITFFEFFLYYMMII